MKTIAETVSRWYNVWLIAGTCYLSTQRTTPYTSGNARLIGMWFNDSSSNIAPDMRLQRRGGVLSVFGNPDDTIAISGAT